MDWAIAVPIIVAIVMIANVLKARYRAMHGIIADEDGNETYVGKADNAETAREIRLLKDRIAVLERVITDDRESNDLKREIEKLREG